MDKRLLDNVHPPVTGACCFALFHFFHSDQFTSYVWALFTAVSSWAAVTAANAVYKRIKGR